MSTTVSPKHVPYFALATIILLGNGYVCFLFFTTRSLRNVTNKFVVSSAFCDILIAVIFVPFYVVFDNILTNVISGYIASLAAFCSLFNLAALTYDRSVAIFKGLRYIEIMNRKRVHLIIALVWLISIFICVLPLTWIGLSEPQSALALHIYQGILTSILIVPNLFIFAVYVKIFQVSRQHINATLKQNSAISKSYPDERETSENIETSVVSPKQGERKLMGLIVMKRDVQSSPRKRASSTKSVSLLAEIKAAKVIAVIFVVNCVCWLPVIIINVCDISTKGGRCKTIPEAFTEASSYFFVINSAVNPFIYAFCKKDFRRVIRKRFTLDRFK